MKILAVGQLPTEVGGNYSTGMGKVMYELSCQSYGTDTLYSLAVNCRHSAARRLGGDRYIGYTFPLLRLCKDALRHPARFRSELRDYRCNLNYSPWRALFYRLNIDRAVRSVNPNIVHLHSIDLVIPFSHSEYAKAAKSVVTCHGIFQTEGNPQRCGYYEDSLSRVDYVSGLTKEIHRKLGGLGVSSQRIFTIPNGVDTSKFRYSESERKRLREEQGISEHTVVFLTVASIQKRKGQLDFLRQLVHSGMDFRYWLIGKGPDSDSILAFAAESGVADRVTLIGYVDAPKLYSYYSAADIYAHVSSEEGQALSEIEAYTTGLRVLVNRKIASTLANEAENNPRYHIVDTDQPLDWDEFRRWAGNPSGAERVPSSRFDWQHIADMYRAMYGKIL